MEGSKVIRCGGQEEIRHGGNTLEEETGKRLKTKKRKERQYYKNT